MSPKVMASFSAFGGDLPSIAFIVLHRLEGYVLWSSVSTNCLHVFLRCSFVVLVISSFICCRVGEVGSLDLRSSRALIFSNISAGTGSVLIRCRPEGICRDAAFRMMVRKIFSLFWQFDGSRLLLSLSSISFPDSMLLAVRQWPTGGSASGPLEICPSGSPEDRRWQPP